MNNVFDHLHDFPVSPVGAWLLFGWIVIVGGAFGSFLNVVAYRLPLGMSLNHPGSRCPQCKHPIRWYHNVPVLGWLVLRGRCHDCGAPISARYPLVEFLVALASGLVCWTAIKSTVVEGDVAYSIDLLAVGLRLFLVYLLFCVALLEFDGNRLPLKLSLCSLLVALIGMWLVPELRPAQQLADAGTPSLDELDYPLVAALLLGLLSWPLFFLSPESTLSDAAARVLLLVLVGLVLGGLAVLSATVLAGGIVVATICMARFWLPGRHIGWAISLLIATLLCMLIAGPQIGADQLAWGETSIYLGEHRAVLALAGVVVAMESVFGRGILAVRRQSLRSLTSEN